MEFFDGQGSSAKSREYMRVGRTPKLYFKAPERGGKEPGRRGRKKQGIAFSNMLEAYEALRSEEKGSRARTTKEGFLYHLLTFCRNRA